MISIDGSGEIPEIARGAIVTVGNSVAMSLPAFDSAWNGKAHILFKDPDGLRYDLAPGGGGPAGRLRAA